MEIHVEKNKEKLLKDVADFLGEKIRQNSNRSVLFSNGASEMRVKTLSFPSEVQKTKNTASACCAVKSERSERDSGGRGLPRSQHSLFLSSGGSSLSILSYLSDDVLRPNITVGMLDERFSRDPMINNFSQMKATSFFKKAQRAGVKFLDEVVQEGDSLEQAGERFDGMLKKWKADNPNGFCIATVGVGSDSHVSGILPYSEDSSLFNSLFENEDVWVVGYDAVNKTQYNERITVTLPFLRTIDEAIVFVTGESKRQALSNVLADTGSLHETPARVVRELKSPTIFTDIKL